MSEEPQQATTSACPHPEAVGKRWGDPISDKREAELQGILNAWKAPRADHGDKKGPFAGAGGPSGVPLTGADVFWLAERVREEGGHVPDLHLEEAWLVEAHLEGATLWSAHLEEATLGQARLERAHPLQAHLETLYVNPMESSHRH
jgi:hypothetical protein